MQLAVYRLLIFMGLISASQSTIAQFDFGMLYGGGYNLSSSFDLSYDQPPLSVDRSNPYFNPNLYAGIWIGSLPYEGKGWRARAQVTWRDLLYDSNVTFAAAPNEPIYLENYGGFAEILFERTFTGKDWWAWSYGGGISVSAFERHRSGFVMTTAALSKHTPWVTMELQGMLGFGVSRERYLLAILDEPFEVTAKHVHYAASFNVLIPLQRGAWLRSLREPSVIYNPRG